ncbi:MAG: GAF domain-containing protein [Cytophagales bacterium]|nr:GAF domain-containing protein [Bernardetiaceae bacterium]MDW8209466.1 GAF domain-containing protein [Cytophagales bacterium]
MRYFYSLTDFKDYRLHSQRLLGLTLWAINASAAVMLLVDLIFGLQSLNEKLLTGAVIGSLFITLLYTRQVNSFWVSQAVIFLIYFTSEAHLFFNSEYFPTTIYWLPFTVLIALITLGLRAAVGWLLIIILTHLANGYYLYHRYGLSYNVQVIVSSYLVSGLLFFGIFFVGIILLYKLLGDAYSITEQRKEELELLKNQIQESKARLEYYQEQLIALTHQPELFEWSPEVFYAYLTKVAAETLQITRVSVWNLNEQQDCLQREYLFCREKVDNLTTVCRKNAQPYFEALLSQPYISAPDARRHQNTSCFNEHYFEPLNIYSLLDCPILEEGKPIGVICYEQQHTFRQWRTEDILFAQSLAGLIAIYRKNRRVRELIEELKQANLQLIDKTHQVEIMNEELNTLNEKLQTINESLEQRVVERTRQLEIQNEQLRGYAFINAHVLRAPLARIRGLLYLMTHDPNAANDWELIHLLIKEANELDAITTKISDILYDGTNLTREDIQKMLAEKAATSNQQNENK